MKDEAQAGFERRGALARLRCLGCGYGVVAAIAPERCPICCGSVWEHAGTRPASAVRADPAARIASRRA